ncbi:MAG: tetratricopeptide repeat protein [Deltaproteobacteria bacterium]|nr:tetratricopeptide repeat protein [Deltaproteobacteria bacterium]
MAIQENRIHHLFQKAARYHLRGQQQKAIALYRRVIQEDPEQADAFHNLGSLYLVSGHYDQAISYCRKAVQLNPHHFDAHLTMASALKRKKAYPEAVTILKRAIRMKPDSAEAQFNLGNLYLEMGDVKKATESFRKVIDINPFDHEAFNNLGTALSRMGKIEEGKTAYRRSLALCPNQVSPHYNLGIAFMKTGDLEMAHEAFHHAINLNPDFSDAYLGLGNLKKTMGNMPEAIGFFRKAIEKNPSSADAYYNLGLSYEGVHDLDNELRTQRLVLQACPESIQTWIGGVRAFSKIGDWKTVDPLLRRIADYPFSENETSLLSSALFMLHSFPISDRKLSKLHRQWGDHVFAEIRRLHGAVGFDFGHLLKTSEKVIRIGYVSPDFRRHSVGWFFKQILEYHDDTLFQVHCYATNPSEDDLTREIKHRAHLFHQVYQWSTMDLARKIHEEKIHILLDLAGHTMGNRLDVFALRPAPIQATMMGYPNGSGLPTMDYRITDRFAETPFSRRGYREKLVELSHGFLPFGLLNHAKLHLNRKNFNLPEGKVLLVSFNRTGKLRPEVLKLWNRLLSRCPDAVLALGCGFSHRSDLRQNISSYFSPANHDRLFFLDRAGSEELHRARYLMADLALDPFPYAGTTTTYESLHMGVPVITLTGKRHVQRTSHSILKHLGISETIAYSEKEYLEKAAVLIENPNSLKALKKKISSTIQRLVHHQPEAFTRTLEKAYLMMWDRYRNHQPCDHIRL